MGKIAVIKTGGKQYLVGEGEKLKVEKLAGEPGQPVLFDTLLTADTSGQNLALGRPGLGDKVQGKIVKSDLGRKVTVVKYKNKTRYLRTKGHRQPFTEVMITKISA